MDKKFMTMAIEEAMKSSELLKCGAVITKNDEVISRAFNSQKASHDATSHAEIKAIRELANSWKIKI